ncbi:MAG: DUF3299 domain-containing protein [Rhodospirillales bacterium]
MSSPIRILSTIALVSGLVCAEAAADDPARELYWEELRPAVGFDTEAEVQRLQAAVAALAPGDRAAFHRIAQQGMIRERLATGMITESNLGPGERRLLVTDLATDHPAAAELVGQAESLRDRRRRFERTVEPAIDGQIVRLPGFALPLAADASGVARFLLVPYAVTCIHVPLPPPNQVVMVTAPVGFAHSGTLAPVWVTGAISVGAGTFDLHLVDGRAPIDAEYALAARIVEPYRD